MSKVSDAEWLEEAARYFENRSTGGEDMAFWANVSNAERCRSIAQSLRSQPAGVRVKGLEWTDLPANSDSYADSEALTWYRVISIDGDWHVMVEGRAPSISRHSDRQTAKAAAQADYERRILSALDQLHKEGEQG